MFSKGQKADEAPQEQTPLQILKDDLQRGHRTLKAYERGIELVDRLQNIEDAIINAEAREKEARSKEETAVADLAEAQKKVDDANAEATRIIQNAMDKSRKLIADTEDSAAQIKSTTEKQVDELKADIAAMTDERAAIQKARDKEQAALDKLEAEKAKSLKQITNALKED